MEQRVLAGIVTWNRAKVLPKALASAFAQNYPNLQMAVIDNGSTDGTADVADQFPTVEWIRWPENRGYMAARNHLMAAENTPYFVCLDDDAWFLKGDEISVAIDYLDSHPDVAAIAFDILSPDRPQEVCRTKPFITSLFIGCGHVIRLAAIRMVGGYEPTPGNYGGEEKDLCLRLLDAGFKIVKLPGVHVWHDKSSLFRDIPAQYSSLVCNDLVMAVRRAPIALLPAVVLVKIYRHTIFSLKSDLWRPCLRGIGCFTRSIPMILRSRSPVKAVTLRTFRRLSRV